MAVSGQWSRVFLALLLAILPPMVMLAAGLILADSILSAAAPAVIAMTIVAGGIAWAAILGVVYSNALADLFSSLFALAQRRVETGEPEHGSAYEVMRSLLRERDRQVTTLAQASSLVPISDAPPVIAMRLIAVLRAAMADPTWRLAVLTSSDPTLLPVGVYPGPDDDQRVGELTELERWAAASLTDQSPVVAEGPWGAFLIVHVRAGEWLRAVLLAPRAGRPSPSAAEADFITLATQHLATAIEHSLLYARLAAQADELARMARIQADFLRGVTHDLQTPLTSIAALATELRADTGLSKEVHEDLETIAHQADRLRRMVGQLLVASRLEAGAYTSQQEVFAVPPVVTRTWEALRLNRPFSLSVVGDPHLGVGDSDRLEQVMWAVLDNAAKYSPESTPIAVRVSPSGGHLAISVTDAGIGMDIETRGRAFDQFYRSSAARMLAPDGSGVGLYAARGIMEAMGGSIGIESTPGAGTTVTLTLPAEPAARADQ